MNTRDLIIKFLKLSHAYNTTNTILTPLLKEHNHVKWRKAAYQFNRQFIQQHDLVFDVGAHNGLMTDIYHRLGATVVAIEPQPSCMDGMRGKYTQGVFFEQVALADTKGQATMFLARGGNNGNSEMSTLNSEVIEIMKTSERVARWNVKWDKEIIVQVTTLDDIINKYGRPRFCKIDVEGYEAQVLMGLSHPIETISIEFNQGYLTGFVSAMGRLTQLGFVAFNYSANRLMKLALPTWVSAQQIINVIGNGDIWQGDVYARRQPPTVDVGF